MLNKHKGQSTVEYIVLVAAVIAVAIAFFTGTGAGTFRNTMNSTLATASGQIDTMTGRMVNAQNSTIARAASFTGLDETTVEKGFCPSGVNPATGVCF